jgi:hypothetical protein
MCTQDFFFFFLEEPYGSAAVTLQASMQASRLAWIFCSYSAAVRMEIFCYFASILLLVFIHVTICRAFVYVFITLTDVMVQIDVYRRIFASR